MGKNGWWLAHLADQADLSGEAGLAQPLVELAGDRQVLMEHHQGVIQYGRECISVRVKYGMVCVEGFGLELARMSREQLIIRGIIHRISVNRGKC